MGGPRPGRGPSIGRLLDAQPKDHAHHAIETNRPPRSIRVDARPEGCDIQKLQALSFPHSENRSPHSWWETERRVPYRRQDEKQNLDDALS